MTSTSGSVARSRATRIGAWALRIVLVLIFAGAAIANIAGLTALVDEFEKIGLGQGFRYFTASMQMAGALLVLGRRTALWGDAILMSISIGALIAQLLVLHGDVIHTIVLIAMVGILGLFDWKKARNSSVQD